MKPITVEGKSIAEAWEKALIKLWEEGIKIPTQYDIDPNTGFRHPPSIDCPMIMYVPEALSEPKLHCCLEGGPADLAEYELEVVSGIKNHWVKMEPNGKEWVYTYSGRLKNYGSNMNFASLVLEGPIDKENPWTQLAYVRKVNGKLFYEVIPPIDQIQHIIDTLSETPYSRRAVALTSFPPADLLVDDPPCLRYIECRGYYRDSCLKIDMNVHFRSRDAFGAALFNMFGLVSLQKYITEKIQLKYNEKCASGQLSKVCPICDGQLFSRDFADVITADKLYCSCGLYPYKVEVGSYTDISDSFHVYGKKLKEFQERFINSAIHQPYDRRFWDLSTDMMQEIIQEGKEKAYKMVESLDAKNNRTGLPSFNQGKEFV